MHGPTCILRANVTPFSLLVQRLTSRTPGAFQPSRNPRLSGPLPPSQVLKALARATLLALLDAEHAALRARGLAHHARDIRLAQPGGRRCHFD